MRTVALALLIGSTLMVGCDDLHRSHLLAADGAGHQVRLPKQPAPPGDARVEASAKRAILVLQKLTDANPGLSVRPMLLTLGSPNKGLFHAGSPQSGMQLYVTDGLINACSDEGQLAAVLSVGLGRMVAQASAGALPPGEGAMPIEERVGSDDRGAFGAADGVRVMEQARREERKKRATRPNGAELARTYLVRAGYSADALKSVAPLIEEADRDVEMRDQYGQTRPAQLMKPVAKPELVGPPRPGT